MESSKDSIETNVNGTISGWMGEWTRERVVFWVSMAYVVISILMVLLWSMYLCIDGRKNPRRDTRVIHMLAQRTVFQLQIDTLTNTARSVQYSHFQHTQAGAVTKTSRRGHSLTRSKSAHVRRRSAIARRSGPGVKDVRVVPSPVPNRRKVNKRKRAKANRIANESDLRLMNNQKKN